MLREICYVIAVYSIMEPMMPLKAQCSVVQFGAALSARECFQILHVDIAKLVGDDLFLCRINKHSLPEGGQGSPPILSFLRASFELGCHLSHVQRLVNMHVFRNGSWLPVPIPFRIRKVFMLLSLMF